LVFARDIEIYGKATVEDPLLGTKTAYCMQTISVQDAPLFSHAIFYNMDLEFHPGPKMDMQGPVHSNGDIYVQAISGLRFHSTLMAAGEIIYGSFQGGVSQKWDVEVKNADGDWRSFDRSGGYYESSMNKWREISTNRWGGNVQSSAHGVPKMKTVGIDDYVPDDPATKTVDERRNHAYAMIEPLVPTDHANYKGDLVREEQFAYKAGLVFDVDRIADSSEPRGYRYEYRAYRYERTSPSDPKSPPKLENGLPKRIEVDLEEIRDSGILSVLRYDEDDDKKPIDDPSKGLGGFYNKRQQMALDVVQLDVGELAELMNDSSGDSWGESGKEFRLKPGSGNDWNGIVYVELPFDDSPTTREDKVMPARRDVALKLVNGEEVPNPFKGNSYGLDEGFTLATNGQLYVKGDFNADGNSKTGSSTKTDGGASDGSDEAPVALVADAITILSDNFDITKSKNWPSNATFTEVSAALVTGLTPSVKGESAGSGGAHNLPRFLENWGKKEFRYRGSLVVLYESEAGIGKMRSNHNSWYNPPIRNWGYSDVFKNMNYPPGTPNARDFRRTNFRFLTQAEYDERIKALSGFDAVSATARGHGTTSCASVASTSSSGSGSGSGSGGG
jgi:hypothetical protein